MDGVLLAGGLASRLGPITKVTNKHLLPIYDKPLIFYGIELLRDLGCERVIIILGGNSVGDIVNLVRDGSQFGVEVVYKFQHEPKGISDAIRLTEDVIKSEQFLVLLGDNIFSNGASLKDAVNLWKRTYDYDKSEEHQQWIADKPWMQNLPASFAVFLHESDHPYDYGQPIFEETANAIKRFVEKDRAVPHNKIVTGLYGLATHAFDIIRNQAPSPRGEYEITDTLSANRYHILHFNYEGFWSDCGTPEGILQASQFMKENSNVTRS